MEDEDCSPIWKIEEVESLILSFYDANHPGSINTAQSLLADFQSSSQAWTIASGLLNRPDEKVKFFGALTIIVKLNRESSSLSEAHAKELLDQLIIWYIDSFRHSFGSLVSRKLASALATFFIHFHQLWPNYIRHLCLSLSSYERPNSTQVLGEGPLNFGCLNQTELKALLWVVTNVMDDIVRLDCNAADNITLFHSVSQHATDATALLDRALTDSDSTAACNDAMKCIQSWVVFAQRLTPSDHHLVTLLRRLMPTVIDLIQTETQFEVASDLVIEILACFPALLTEEHFQQLYSLLVSSWSNERYCRLLQDSSNFSSAQFGQLLLSVGDEKCQYLMQANNAHSRTLLAKLCGLLSSNGYPAIENKMFVPAVEFWSNFTETLSEVAGSDQLSETPWAKEALNLVSDAVSHAWQKIIYPPPFEMNEWDSSDKAGFTEARKDVVDFLQAVYALSGPQLAATFSNIVLISLHEAAWLRLEAAAFCLAGLAECGEEDQRFDDMLTAVFGSPLFSSLASGGEELPPRTKQTCLYLIEQYTGYFERNITFLGPALRLLFNLLAVQSMAASASRSILRLCSSCRHHLHSESEYFFEEYRTLTDLGGLDCLSSEKVAGAVASITQAIPDESQRVHASYRLLGSVQHDVSRAKNLLHLPRETRLACFEQRCWDCTANEHPSLHTALKALKCLSAIARGFQAPNEGVIDLDVGARQKQVNTPFAIAHQQVMEIIVDIEKMFLGNSEVMELICSVLRCGFSETEAGPFVLGTDIVTNYLTSHFGHVPRPGLLVTTACSFISSLDGRYNVLTDSICIVLLQWVVALLENLPEPDHDPELSQHSIDFARRVLLKNPPALLMMQPAATAEFLFLFAIRLLEGTEPLPKSAAADFWTTLISLRSDEEQVNEASVQAMNVLGPLLLRSLARNIGGQASRSELDKLSEPIKKLFSRYHMAKDWLNAGLYGDSFPSDKVTSEQKSLFVKKLVGLRGSRVTNRVIREFWLSARGTNFSYAS